MSPGQFLAFCIPIKMQYNERMITPLHITPDGTRCRWVIRDKGCLLYTSPSPRDS